MMKRLLHATALSVMAALTLHAQTPTTGEIPIVTPHLTDEVIAYRRSLPEERPPLRGWRTPILENAGRTWPFTEPDASAPPEMRQAADAVALRLARDGLLSTLAKVIEILGPARFGKDPAADVDLLRSVGLPIDGLACFAIPGVVHGDVAGTISFIARRLTSGQSDALRGELAAAAFHFTRTHANFRLATESGEEEVGLVRVQLAKGEYWHGIGDGGALDIIRQLTAALPDATFLVSTEHDQTTRLIGLMRLWPHLRPARVTVIAEPLAVGQWAQDNGKAGVIESDTTAKRRKATLAPRYASRGDDGSTFIPGESFMADGWAAAEQTVLQSPLIFQGGNLMAVRDPKSGERILLIGEAEIYRNTALGLTREQVESALRIEMGVDRSVVLPAVSYHIDYEVSVRAVGDTLVALVNDAPAATKAIIAIGLDALRSGGLLTPQEADSARGWLDAGRGQELNQLLDERVFHGARQQGQFPASLTRCFSKSLIDSDVGNFQRFLLALDLFVAEAEPANSPGTDPNLAEYRAAIRRRNAERRRLHEQLAGLGWHIVAVPSLGEAERGINYLNGIHAKGLYLMPIHGGLYARLDDRAAKVIGDAIGPNVRILPILSAESQRRNGAVHCAASVYPPTR